MPLQLLHQVGHNSNWNVESFQDDHCGDGDSESLASKHVDG